jgi:sugar-specific transcriptional regulator TrmB
MTEVTQTLTNLGLKRIQIKVLLALHKFDYATVKHIAKAAEIHRQQIYPVLKELQKLGLIERRIDIPNQYKAIQLSEALKILLQRQNNWVSEVQEKTMELIQKVNAELELRERVQREDYDFTLITGLERFSRALIDWMENAQTIDEVIKFDNFAYQIGDRLKVSTVRYREDVKVRLVTCTRPENVHMPLKDKNLEIRCAPFETPVDIAVYNGNRGHLAIFSNRESVLQTEVAALTSNHPCFVKMLQNYFDVLWNSAKIRNRGSGKKKRPAGKYTTEQFSQ